MINLNPKRHQVHGNLYGTSFAALQSVCDSGHVPVVDGSVAAVLIHKYLYIYDIVFKYQMKDDQ